MNQGMIRGYSVMRQFDYIDYAFDAKVARDLKAKVMAETGTSMTDLKPAEWYPRSFSSAVLRAVASVKDDEQGSYNDLVACGEYIATEATNTFLRLLMRLLNPVTFAKKIPTFWERDMKGGLMECDVSRAAENRLVLKLLDVEGYDHISAVTAGWIRFGMAAVGQPSVKVQQTGWTLARPGPRDVHYEVTWS